jgi:hypothetical protein
VIGDDFRAAFAQGKASARKIGARNPYLPAEPNSHRMRLAQCWNQGRVDDMPASFDRG